LNIAFLCVLIISLFPFLMAGFAKYGGAQAGRRFDNNHPRAWLSGLEGWPQRAHAAQMNSWEALPIFVAAVLMAKVAVVPAATLDFWAVWFVLARVLYAGLYITDRASLRSVVWVLGMIAPVRLMIAAM